MLVFFYDILVYSPCIESHVQNLHMGLEILRKHCYFVKESKHTFVAIQVKYLGHFISGGVVSADPKKIKAVL